MATLIPVITEQTGNGIVYLRRLSEREFDGGLEGLEAHEAPGTLAAVGKYSFVTAHFYWARQSRKGARHMHRIARKQLDGKGTGANY